MKKPIYLLFAMLAIATPSNYVLAQETEEQQYEIIDELLAEEYDLVAEQLCNATKFLTEKDLLKKFKSQSNAGISEERLDELASLTVYKQENMTYEEINELCNS